MPAPIPCPTPKGTSAWYLPVGSRSRVSRTPRSTSTSGLARSMLTLRPAGWEVVQEEYRASLPHRRQLARAVSTPISGAKLLEVSPRTHTYRAPFKGHKPLIFLSEYLSMDTEGWEDQVPCTRPTSGLGTPSGSEVFFLESLPLCSAPCLPPSPAPQILSLPRLHSHPPLCIL